ncbi:MAG: MFS transporter, partial [Desulfitobacterium hafniense]
MSFLMIAFALVFPIVLRREKVLHWLFGACGLLLFTVGITAIRNRAQSPPESSITVDEPKEDDMFCLDEAAISHQEEVAISYQEEDTVSLSAEDGPSDPVEEKRADTPEVLLPEHEQEATEEEAVKEEAGDAEPMEIFVEDEESVETEANRSEEANI